MTQSPLNFSATGKPAQIQENLIAYMRLFAVLPGTFMQDDGEIFWFINGKSAPGDTVLRTRWSAEGIEARIDALFAVIGSHVNEVSWLIFPGDSPADLGSRLERRGMPGGGAGNWLWADLTSLCPSPAVSQDFHIARVNDDTGMAEWVRASEAGYHEDLTDYYHAYARHGYGSDAFALHYTGYLGDIPVTTGTLLEAGGCASVYNISTPPVYRRQGFGGAITHAMLVEIRQRGYRDTWIWSSDDGKGVYRKLGYRDADFGLREHKWSR